MKALNAGSPLETVVDYVKRGWEIFPVAANRKIPLTEHGFKDATTDLAQLSDYWGRYPDANVGIATGQRSNLVVIDVDVKTDIDGHKSLEKFDLPQTLAARTPSGGTHYYFLYPNIDIRSRVGILPGVDVRADGGYVVGPPSEADGFPYEWLNELEPAALTTELLELLKDRHSALTRPKTGTVVPEGTRNEVLFREACSLRSKGKEAADIEKILRAINHERCRPPLPDAEVAAIADSSCRYDPGESVRRSTSASDRILNVVDAARCELFHARDQQPYVSIVENEHRETWHIDSQHFRFWLCSQVFNKHGMNPNANALEDALRTLKGRALFDGPEKDVHLRVAKLDTGYMIDLCNDRWQAVQITPAGWQVIDLPTIRFRRTATMRALPVPERGGKIEDLRKVLNIREQDLTLVLAFILESFRPDTPYPILELTGSQGAAKSTTQDRIRQFIDPNESNLRTDPQNDDAIIVSARNNHVVSYNNLSSLTKRRQDILCSISTGGGSGARTLYTNAEETVIEIKRPILINGINSVATNQDLVDRVVSLELPSIKRERRRTDQELEVEFRLLWPSVFGAVLDVFAKTLKALPEVRPRELERMADFHILGTAMCNALEWSSFDNVFRKNRRKAALEALESSPVARAVVDFMDREGSFEGTYLELLRELSYFKSFDEAWPKSPRGLCSALERQSGALNLVGITITKLGHTRHGSKLRISKISSKSSSQRSQRSLSGHAR